MNRTKLQRKRIERKIVCYSQQNQNKENQKNGSNHKKKKMCMKPRSFFFLYVVELVFFGRFSKFKTWQFSTLSLVVFLHTFEAVAETQIRTPNLFVSVGLHLLQSNSKILLIFFFNNLECWMSYPCHAYTIYVCIIMMHNAQTPFEKKKTSIQMVRGSCNMWLPGLSRKYFWYTFVVYMHCLLSFVKMSCSVFGVRAVMFVGCFFHSFKFHHKPSTHTSYTVHNWLNSHCIVAHNVAFIRQSNYKINIAKD